MGNIVQLNQAVIIILLYSFALYINSHRVCGRMNVKINDTKYIYLI